MTLNNNTYYLIILSLAWLTVVELSKGQIVVGIIVAVIGVWFYFWGKNRVM